VKDQSLDQSVAAEAPSGTGYKNNMNKQLFREYYELESQIKTLESKKDEMRVQCLLQMKEDKLESVREEFGTFSIVSIRRFEYTPKVKEAEENVKVLKKAEEDLGLAKVTTFDTLRFATLKVKEQKNG
jgi:uncharacterized protein YdcH (DUF465 family)